jgi:hypothetical protein
MKIKFILVSVLSFAVASIMVMGCKKNNSTPTPTASLAGDWKLSNIQGKIDTAINGSDNAFLTSYNNSTKMKVQQYNNTAPQIYPYTLEVNIKADLTNAAISVRETRTQQGMSFDNTYPGTLVKISNTITLNGFENTDFFGDFNSKTFCVNSLTSTTLVLTYVYVSTTVDPTTTITTAYTLTFSK